MALKLSDFDVGLIEEVSTLSGYSEQTVREVMELIFFRQLEQAMQNQDLHIPFLGKIHVVHQGDVFVGGTREAKFDCLFAPSDLFKRVEGDIIDGDSELLFDIFNKKIGSVLQEKLDTGRS